MMFNISILAKILECSTPTQMPRGGEIVKGRGGDGREGEGSKSRGSLVRGEICLGLLLTLSQGGDVQGGIYISRLPNEKDDRSAIKIIYQHTAAYSS